MIRTCLLIATLYPPIDNSLVALSGHINIVEGNSLGRNEGRGIWITVPLSAE